MNTYSIFKQAFLVLLFSTFLTSVFGSNTTSINFLKKDSFKEILAEAKRQNKPVFVDFHASWCVPCREMDRNVFQKRDVANFMNYNFVNYKVDTEKGNGPMISLIFDIKYLPTTIIVHPSGKLMLKKVTSMNKEAFIDWAKEGILEYARAITYRNVKSTYSKFELERRGNKSNTIDKYQSFNRFYQRKEE